MRIFDKKECQKFWNSGKKPLWKKPKIPEALSCEKLIIWIECLAYFPSKEIPLDLIEKILFLMAGERKKYGRGTKIHYYHPSLINEKFFTEGYFQVHRIHGSKIEKIRTRDYKPYILPALRIIWKKRCEETEIK